MSDPLLAVSNVETFYDHIQALRGISLEVPEGRIVAVLGANGAGKSTTLMTVSGILRIRSGRIAYEGHDLTRASPGNRACGPDAHHRQYAYRRPPPVPHHAPTSSVAPARK